MWEELEKQGNRKWGFVTERMKVYGGWIVRSIHSSVGGNTAVAQSFVPDPEHLWKLDKDMTSVSYG